MGARAGHGAKSRPKNTIPVFAIILEYWYISTIMVTASQWQEHRLMFLKPKVALALVHTVESRKKLRLITTIFNCVIYVAHTSRKC